MVFVVFVVREDDELAVSLVAPVLAVREVVADQLGVHAGPVVAAEVSGLLHVQVEVEGPGGGQNAALSLVETSPDTGL